MRPRAGTEHNFSLQRWITFPPPGSPLPRSVFLSLSQLLHCLSLISLFPVLFSPSPSLSISISCSPPSASPFISWSLFLALSLYLSLSLSLSLSRSLPPLPSFCLDTPRGTSLSAVGLELEASFIEFAQGPGKAYLPIRSWWGASSLWANPQIPSQTCVCVCLSVCVCLLHVLPFVQCYVLDFQILHRGGLILHIESQA